MGGTVYTRARGRALIRLAGAVLGISTVLALVGCGAGQITQTDTEVASVNGANGDAGPIAVRNAQLTFPDNADRYYHPGDRAPLEVYIANSGQITDKLTSVRSPAAAGAEISGGTTLFPATALRAMSPNGATPKQSTGAGVPPAEQSVGASVSKSPSESAPGSSSSAESVVTRSSSAAGTESRIDELPISRITIVLTGLNRQVRPGQTISVTFSFAKAGQVRLDLPVGNPETTEGKE